jgi:uncharacterized protein (TIGR02118 family)
MIVRFSCAPRAPGLSYEEFQEHWRGEHGRLAGGIEGLRAYMQNHAVLNEGRPLLPWPGFDACAEIEFDSLNAMERGFRSDYYQGAVVADEQLLVDKSRGFSPLLAERRVLAGGEPPPDAIKLLTVLVLSPGASPSELAEALAGRYPDSLSGVPLLRHEQLLEIPIARDGGRPAFCAAVDLLWFKQAQDALDFVSGPAGDRARLTLAGLVSGTERLIARPVRVM